MNLLRRSFVFGLLFWLSSVSIARTALSQVNGSTACPPPVLSRLVRHKVKPGETTASIAKQHNLIPATLMGLNPVMRSGKAPIGTEILVPPYNGIRVELQSNQTWRDVAKKYGVRPDVLFEVNGCQPTPKVVFVPGVNWSPVNVPGQNASAQAARILSGYPLSSKPSQSAILLGYGWGIQPTIGKVGFHGGVDLAAAPGTSVLAVGDGTIAFSGNQGTYGKLIVINHPEGLQTRYAQLGNIKVKVGQTVRKGQVIGTVGSSGRPSSTRTHLHFEVRSRSKLGWVAENPESYLLRDRQHPNQAKK
ncbi:peptidoglycan DD-metalloendopeptidase family protein [Leptothermofonsia sp. ETS-13]|uniref:peptidoglycan DD-metalloendopeptidase family protein n=1 Tax=Leptothermofonsia sp. ETS-13 TaxID=3035696 RepID=UPI003BA32C0F